LASKANQLAELDAGLDIIQEAFTDYQTAVANGQSSNTTPANLRQVLNKSIRIWTQELKQDCRQLRVGW
jgi:type II secretory pathway component PulM